MKCFLDRRSSFSVLRLKTPIFLSHISFLVSLLRLEDLGRRLDPYGDGEILCFCLDPLHVCSKLRAVLESISLVPPCVQPDCQRLPLFIPTARLPAFATLYPNSQTASVCHSLSQQPDCQRLPLFIPTARLPAFATLYPNSQTASVCHSLSQQPDCQRLPLFIPTAMPPLGTGLHRRLRFCYRGCLP